MKRIAALVEELIHGPVAAEGYELVYVEFQTHSSPPVLRVYIDRPGGGIGLDDCRRVSRQVGVLLDVEDFIPSQYVLEVSSPGIERPLFREADYERFRGREIRLIATEKIEERKRFQGVIRSFADGILGLECDGRLYRIPFEKIQKANLVFHFD